MGYFFSLAKFERINNAKYLNCALWVPVFFHGAYDAVLFMIDIREMNEGVVGLLYLMFLVIYVCMWVCAIKRIRHLASLLVPEGPEEDALKTCTQCGNVYKSNLKMCPKCGSQEVKIYDAELEQDPDPESESGAQFWETLGTGEEQDE